MLISSPSAYSWLVVLCSSILVLSGSSRARPAEQARSSAFLRSEHQRSFRGGAGPTDGERWIEQQVKGNLAAVMADVPGTNARDLPNGALAALVLNGPTPTACAIASELLHKFGDRFDTSFGGQGVPPVLINFSRCFNESEAAWLASAINRSLPATIAEATPQEVSYTNMWLMSTINSILFGEIAGDTPRGVQAATVGYTMLEQWAAYTDTAGVHEFTSPTYTYVQLTALYTGYIHAAQPRGREIIKRALDLVWAAIAANWYAPQSSLSGPHSRDYDTLLGHGMLNMEAYLHGLPGAVPLQCELEDPHCEGPMAAVNKSAFGDGEPMTVLAISLYNYRHPRGYRPSSEILALAELPTRVIRHRFLGQNVTFNGNAAEFSDTYNYVVSDAYAIGSASQDYITNTHHAYWPNPQDKLVNVLLGGSGAKDVPRPTAQISVQPDWMNSPYGLWKLYPGGLDRLERASHLALHPGMVQWENVLLATVALNGNDALDGFTTARDAGNLYTSLATNVLLPLDADELVLRFTNGTTSVLSPWITPTHTFGHVLPPNTVVGVRVGLGMLAIRVFACDGASGVAPVVSLVGDTVGLRLRVIRLVCQHFVSKKPQQVTDKHVRWGALVVADRYGANASLDSGRESPYKETSASASLNQLVQHVAAALIRSITAGGGEAATWTAVATVASTTLEVERSLGCQRNRPANATWNCIVARRVNNASIVPSARLLVNGKEVAEPLLPPPAQSS